MLYSMLLGGRKLELNQWLALYSRCTVHWYSIPEEVAVLTENISCNMQDDVNEVVFSIKTCTLILCMQYKFCMLHLKRIWCYWTIIKAQIFIKLNSFVSKGGKTLGVKVCRMLFQILLKRYFYSIMTLFDTSLHKMSEYMSYNEIWFCI